MNSHHLWIFFSSCAATHHVSVAPTRPPSMETGKMMSFMSFLSCRRASWTAAPYRRRPPNSGNRPPGPLPPPSAVLLENNQSGGGKKTKKGNTGLRPQRECPIVSWIYIQLYIDDKHPHPPSHRLLPYTRLLNSDPPQTIEGCPSSPHPAPASALRRRSGTSASAAIEVGTSAAGPRPRSLA